MSWSTYGKQRVASALRYDKADSDIPRKKIQVIIKTTLEKNAGKSASDIELMELFRLGKELSHKYAPTKITDTPEIVIEVPDDFVEAFYESTLRYLDMPPKNDPDADGLTLVYSLNDQEMQSYFLGQLCLQAKWMTDQNSERQIVIQLGDYTDAVKNQIAGRVATLTTRREQDGRLVVSIPQTATSQNQDHLHILLLNALLHLGLTNEKSTPAPRIGTISRRFQTGL